MEYYPEYSENDFRLYHHGILGMKWGKKNGPPYPLGASDHSASEKKAGWRKSLSDAYSKIKEKRAANKYDYRTSDKYKNTNTSGKQYLDSEYNVKKATLGKRGANRYEYAKNVKGLKGKELKAVESTEFKKRIATAVATTAALYAADYLMRKGLPAYANARRLVKASGDSFKAYARVEGLNTIRKGGFTLGTKQLLHGAELFSKYGDAAFSMFK